MYIHFRQLGSSFDAEIGKSAVKYSGCGAREWSVLDWPPPSACRKAEADRVRMEVGMEAKDIELHYCYIYKFLCLVPRCYVIPFVYFFFPVFIRFFSSFSVYSFVRRICCLNRKSRNLVYSSSRKGIDSFSQVMKIFCLPYYMDTSNGRAQPSWPRLRYKC